MIFLCQTWQLIHAIFITQHTHTVDCDDVEELKHVKHLIWIWNMLIYAWALPLYLLYLILLCIITHHDFEINNVLCEFLFLFPYRQPVFHLFLVQLLNLWFMLCWWNEYQLFTQMMLCILRSIIIYSANFFIQLFFQKRAWIVRRLFSYKHMNSKFKIKQQLFLSNLTTPIQIQCNLTVSLSIHLCYECNSTVLRYKVQSYVMKIVLQAKQHND